MKADGATWLFYFVGALVIIIGLLTLVVPYVNSQKENALDAIRSCTCIENKTKLDVQGVSETIGKGKDPFNMAEVHICNCGNGTLLDGIRLAANVTFPCTTANKVPGGERILSDLRLPLKFDKVVLKHGDEVFFDFVDLRVYIGDPYNNYYSFRNRPIPAPSALPATELDPRATFGLMKSDNGFVIVKVFDKGEVTANFSRHITYVSDTDEICGWGGVT
jgi:hypothetical protein